MNRLRKGTEFASFPNLQTLIVDGNLFVSVEDFPVLSNLQDFSINKNGIENTD